MARYFGNKVISGEIPGLTDDQLDTIKSGITESKVSSYDDHLNNTSNPHSVTKAQVGLGNVDNTSDANKPVSTAQQAALDLKADKSTTYTKTEVDNAVVHKTGNEIIQGTKIFDGSTVNFKTSGVQINCYQTNMDVTTSQATTLYGGIQFNDKNGKRMGKIETFNNANANEGYVSFGMNSTRYFDINGTSTAYHSQLKLCVDDDKVPRCYLPKQVYATTFNGTATTALWADLAEKYKSDEQYPVGTLICFGGKQDITIAKINCNGVISDKPGYLLDNDLEDAQPVALVGKTPIRVIGKIKKFDRIVLSEIPGIGRAQTTSDEKIIAVALEDNDNSEEKLVKCVTKFTLD